MLEFPALPPAPVALALPSMASAVSMTLALGLTLLAGSVATGMTLCSAPMPMTFSQALDPDHAIWRWLSTALPLALKRLGSLQRQQATRKRSPETTAA
ncbi:MAG: hypothetical protein MH252_18490 [Thermosynechococcaceae cyanobacterium MS004]|nr:hypothetical protein [Thermosynechococcaceae cyanobacterium MS004]